MDVIDVSFFSSSKVSVQNLQVNKKKGGNLVTSLVAKTNELHKKNPTIIILEK